MDLRQYSELTEMIDMKMNLRTLAVVLLSVASFTLLYGQDYFESSKPGWLEIARSTTPVLHEEILRPVAAVRAVQDPSAFQGWRYESLGTPDFHAKNFKEVGEITLDFGRHITGYFSFHTKVLNNSQDAPVKLKFMFGELPAEMNTPLDPWKGTLSRGWMQDEIVTLTDMDEWVTLPRRMSFRYLRIELLGSSAGFDFAIDDLFFKAVSSAGENQVPLLETCPEEIREIARVSEATLKECMQTVFEDGPKRDHRLWSGDLYLQSLANRYSFRNFELVKHCLYMFAAFAGENGVLWSNVYDFPKWGPQYGSYCLTYCLIWNSTLLEYLKDTGDYQTATDLWKVAKRQIEDAMTYMRPDNIFDINARPVWLFFDHRAGLDVNAMMQAAMIFALKDTYELATMIGCADEVKEYPALVKAMTKAARKAYYDKDKAVVVSGPGAQVSILSQTWMIKAGVLSPKEGRKAIVNALADPETLMPSGPYATHYLIDAMMICGMHEQAREYLVDYWGGMVRKGADTFWECYDPDDDMLTPYSFFPLNSACHAWSCTPTYFIGKYPEVFQK